jgi:hypothetical protein
MPIYRITTGAVSKAVHAIYRYGASGWQKVLKVKRLNVDGVTWDTVGQFAPPITATISPASVGGSGNSPSPITITTNAATMGISGGQGPYSYAWSVDTYLGVGSLLINAPANATSSFTMTGVVSGDSQFAILRCTVTDAFGQTATDTVDASFINFDFA